MPFFLFELGGGDGSATQVYDESTDGVGLRAGTAGVIWKINNPTVTGGVQCSGTATVTKLSDGDGGVYGSGSCVLSKITTHTVTGGMYVAGAASSVVISETGGGITVNSGAVQRQVLNNRNITGEGVKIGGNQTIVSQRYLNSCAGGVVANGAARFGLRTTKTVTGGMKAAGNATISLVSSRTATGGVLLNGSGAPQVLIDMSGGIVVNGITTFAFKYNINPTGGLGAGSTAIVQTKLTVAPTGGVWLNGNPTVSAVIYSAFDDVLLDENGNVLSDENGVPLYQEDGYPIGVGGTATMNVRYNITPTGGVKAAGHGALRFNDIASGGVLVGGEYFAYLYRETGSGGAKLGGTAQPIVDHIYIKAHCTTITTVKCGYEREDQFCAEWTPVQGHGSKFFKVERRDPRYVCAPSRDTTVCRGSTAMVAAITLCQQRLRLHPGDLPPPRILSLAEEPLAEEFSMLSLGRPKSLLDRIRSRGAGTPNQVEVLSEAL